MYFLTAGHLQVNLNINIEIYVTISKYIQKICTCVHVQICTCVTIQEYNIDIKHIKGKDNMIADALSRV